MAQLKTGSTVNGVVIATTNDLHSHSNKTALDAVSGTNTGNETTTTIGTLVNGATAKVTPIDGDMVGLMDSASSNILKKLSWANIKATLKTYFDTLYNNYVHPSGFTNEPAVALTGANVISQIGVTGEGHVDTITSRVLTASDIGAATSTHTHASTAITDKGLANGVASLDSTGKVPSGQLPQVGLLPQLAVTAPTGSTVTCTKDATTLTATEAAGTWTFDLPYYGTWTVNATQSGKSASESVAVDTVKQYSLSLAYVNIYGAAWDGTSTTAFSRTDDAAGFTNPVPYISGAGSYSSPFDALQPWAGMVRTTDAAAGELVAIPKYWFKWTKSGASMTLQIAEKAVAGFSVSPAHADRGDGTGERDTVYVGRYHCGSTAYKSVSGQSPKANITRATARTSIAALGTKIWQYDFAMYWTIMMLYLVEFADWDSQAKIGYGCGNNSTAQNVGASDSMPYHTGTMQTARTTYGVGCQYRYIEGLWDNVYDWCDGIYFSSANVYCIKNPASFSDTVNGTLVGTRPTSSNYISAWSIPSASGFEYALYPSAVAGSESTYICDYCSYNSIGVVLDCGGSYSQGQNRGLFYLNSSNAASDSGPSIGCRLQKLP